MCGAGIPTPAGGAAGGAAAIVRRCLSQLGRNLTATVNLKDTRREWLHSGGLVFVLLRFWSNPYTHTESVEVGESTRVDKMQKMD
jgi:hypothetical protein